MTHYYLARWTWDAAQLAFVPSGYDLAPTWDVCDLRPDSTVGDGRCIFASSVQLPNSPNRFYLGDNLDQSSSALKTGIESRLGITLASTDTTLRKILIALFIEHGDDARLDRWNRLKAGFDRMYRIFLGGEQIAAIPVVSGGAVITDSFTRANNADMSVGAPFNWTDVAGDNAINSNRAQNNISTNACFSRAESDLATSNHYAQANWSWQSNAATIGGLCVRYASAADTCYFVQRSGQANSLRIYKRVAGVSTALQSAQTCTALALGVEDLTRLEVTGSSLSATCTGGLSNVTDTSITTGTRAGIWGSGAGTLRSRFTNFEAGDLGGSTTVTPSVIAAIVSFGASVISASSDVAPASIGAIVSIGTPVVQASGTASPSAIAAVVSIMSPTIVASGTVVPSTITSIVSIDQPVIQASGTTTPSAIASVVSIDQPVIQASSTTTPSAIVATVVIGTPVIAIGQIVYPTTISTTVAFGSTTVLATATVVPASIAATVSIGAPQIVATGTTTPASIAAFVVIAQPVVTAAAVLTPVPITAHVSVSAPILMSSATLTPQPIAATASIGSPVVTIEGAEGKPTLYFPLATEPFDNSKSSLALSSTRSTVGTSTTRSSERA